MAAEGGAGGTAASAVDYKAVAEDIKGLLDAPGYDDGSYAPLLVRLAWHASGTYAHGTRDGGSDGATMRYEPESTDGANAGLGIARDLLAPLKDKHAGISYADLWTLAGCVAVEAMGGPHIDWRAGRSDAPPPPEGKVPPNGRLPDGDKGADHVRAIFGRMGFNDREIVALIGAHDVGRCHADRSGFDGPWTRRPTTFSNSYFKHLAGDETYEESKVESTGNPQLKNADGSLMMLIADMALKTDPTFKAVVDEYAADQDVFFRDFAAAFKKLLELGVKFE